MKANRYTKRLDAYQHLIIMLYAQLGQFESLREVELGFLCAASRMNHFGMDYMVRRSTLSDADARRSPAFFEAVYNALYERYSSLLGVTRKFLCLDVKTKTSKTPWICVEPVG